MIDLPYSDRALTVTAINIAEVRRLSVRELEALVAPGCTTWRIVCAGGIPGQIITHADGTAAISYGYGKVLHGQLDGQGAIRFPRNGGRVDFEGTVLDSMASARRAA